MEEIRKISQRFQEPPSCGHEYCLDLWKAVHILCGMVFGLLPEMERQKMVKK